MGYNPSKAIGSCIVTARDEFSRYLFGIWNKVSVNILSQDVALASVQETNEYTEHAKSNVYISTLVSNCTKMLMNWFVEFVSGGPKTCGLKSRSGRKDIVKAKGFSLHYANQQTLNFNSFKEQLLIKSMSEDIMSLGEEQHTKK